MTTVPTPTPARLAQALATYTTLLGQNEELSAEVYLWRVTQALEQAARPGLAFWTPTPRCLGTLLPHLGRIDAPWSPDPQSDNPFLRQLAERMSPLSMLIWNARRRKAAHLIGSGRPFSQEELAARFPTVSRAEGRRRAAEVLRWLQEQTAEEEAALALRLLAAPSPLRVVAP